MTKQLRHAVIDLETLDLIPSSKIASIGSVIFDPRYGKISKDTFYCEVDLSTQDNRTASQETLMWWHNQPLEVRKALNGTTPLSDALEDLAFWLPDDCKVWGNGATFDISMLEDAYRQLNIDIPWKFWNIRDVRTIKDIYESFRGGFGREPSGGNHNALQDAILEAKLVNKMWKFISLGNNE